MCIGVGIIINGAGSARLFCRSWRRGAASSSARHGSSSAHRSLGAASATLGALAAAAAAA